MIKVLYVGDAAGVLGPSFIASPFNLENKGFSYPEWTKAPMGPNRLRSLRDYVAEGGSLCMIGGWSSFSGRFGTAAYQNTPVEEALPVKCVPAGDDRVETPEGTWIEVLDEKHPVTREMPWEKCPCFLGYNRIIAKEGAKVLARTKEKGDPFIVVWDFEEGRGIAFASDVSPHWAVAFQKWEYYGQFFRQTVRWLAKVDQV